MKFKQLVLIILDGFGVASASDGNAVTAGSPKNLNHLINHYPATTIQASGPSVGLPWGERGNSEVGHMNIGAGRIVSQDLARISNAIGRGDFYKNPAFLAAAEHVRKNRSNLHLVGLLSGGSVHSAEEHLYALLSFAAEQKLTEVFVHAFTDGRDAPPKSAIANLDRLSRKFAETGVGRMASVTGRFYAMDRGEHWELTDATYQALTEGAGKTASSARGAVEKYYEDQIYDETIPPTVITADQGRPLGLVREGDAVVFFNFRPDRMRQLVQAFIDPAFAKFSKKSGYLQNMFYVTMTLYAGDLAATVAFPPLEIKNGLAEVMASNKLTQAHLSESEKYAHVTYFFNGGREAPWPMEEREIVNSPADYQNRYENVPEMSVKRLGEKTIEKIRAGTNFVLVNFANPDVVGHTGNRQACIRAVQAVDKVLGSIFAAAFKEGACLMITADHGKIEQIFDIRTGQLDTEHSLNPVPLLIAGPGLDLKQSRYNGYLELPSIVPEGVLSDIAPTILELMGLEKPPEMTAVSLLPFLLKQIEKPYKYEASLESKTKVF